VRLHVDSWDPAYGTGFEGGAEPGPARESSAELALDVELPAAAWRPIDPPGRRPPPVVLLVDGVRRVDARVWVGDDAGDTHPGLAASYAAGVVRCDADRGSAEVVGARIARGLFTPCAEVADVAAGSVRYTGHRVGRGEPMDLVNGVQAQLRGLEAAVSDAARAGGDELLVVDGQLKERAHLPRTLGYIKTHSKPYLPAELGAVVTALRPGQRSPVFLLGTRWHRYTWYLRLPGPSGAPFAGIVRVECAAELTPEGAVELAGLSAVTLPRFAATSYKDPRAPQNLVPIAGLERRLRGMLGDPRLLHRCLTAAARRPVPAR
jgi:hypothetical protein